MQATEQPAQRTVTRWVGNQCRGAQPVTTQAGAHDGAQTDLAGRLRALHRPRCVCDAVRRAAAGEGPDLYRYSKGFQMHPIVYVLIAVGALAVLCFLYMAL